MSEALTEGQRKGVYIALLRGLAKTAQDRLCAADERHDWSPWHRTMLQKDDGPLKFDPIGSTMNEVVRIRADRECLNCGKREMQ